MPLIDLDAAIAALTERQSNYREESTTWAQIGLDILTIRALPTVQPEPAPADPVAEAARVYIASKALHGPKWVQLRDAGLPIISTWIDESGVGETINWPGLWSRCISEASDCTHLIAYRELGEILKGAWAEVGAALAHGRKVILCGDFTEFSIKHHPNVTIWASSDIRTALRAITEASHAAD